MYENWQEEYKSKFIEADAAANMVKSGDTVVFTMGREAYALGLMLAARKDELKDVTVYAPTPGYDLGWYDEGWQDSFTIKIIMPTGTCQEAVDAHRISPVPDPIASNFVPDPDVVFAEVSPPDEKGFVSFGQSLWNKRRQVLSSKLVIGEVNENLIRTYGENYVHISDINYFVEHLSSGAGMGTGSMAGREKKAPEPYLQDITNNVASLIKDGDTIQIGVGRTTEPLIAMGLLNGKKDIGVHSEATPPGIISKVKDGTVNGSRKSLHPGLVIVTSLGGGSAEEMRWASNNPLFQLLPMDYVINPMTICQNDNQVAINNALAVTLDGQITSETIGPRLISSTGGQLAFTIGTLWSRGGRAITVLPSTSHGNSRIVPMFEQGTVTTVPRTLADCIVTEYGVARLRGLSLKERAQAMIAIAHPDHRAELKKQAAKLF